MIYTRTSTTQNLEISFIFYKIHSLFSSNQKSFFLLDEIANATARVNKPLKLLNHAMDKNPSRVILNYSDDSPFRIFIIATSNHNTDFSIPNLALTIV
jgi:hypothetical protein